jgi:hypothetical protein
VFRFPDRTGSRYRRLWWQTVKDLRETVARSSWLLQSEYDVSFWVSQRHSWPVGGLWRHLCRGRLGCQPEFDWQIVQDGGQWLQDELARIILKRLSARIRHLSGEHRCHFPRCQQPVLVVWPVLPPCAALQISSSGFVARVIRLVRCPAAGALYLPPSSAAMLFPGQVCVRPEKYAVRPARSAIQIFELGEDLGRPLELRRERANLSPTKLDC